jgi:hypothetical protein
VERFEAVWQPWEGHGMERLRVAVSAEGVHAEGDVLHPDGFALHYRVRTDPAWATRHVEVTLRAERPRMLRLHADGAGAWTDDHGTALPDLDGCLDVDLAFSPFTNTLAIRRLALREGASGDTRVALVSAPELTVAPDPQRYTRLAVDRYRFDSLDSDFTRELAVDEHALLLDYPGLFRRLREH